MFVGVLTVDIFIPESNSLKAKRFVVKSLKDRIRNRFNVSVSEVDSHSLWQRAKIAVAAVSKEKQNLQSLLRNVADFIGDEKRIQVIDMTFEEY
ncbi:MAG: DUF503 domain-containing protein [bacterium]